MIPLGLTAVSAAADAELHYKILWSGTKILIISNEETEGIMKTGKYFKDSDFIDKRCY